MVRADAMTPLVDVSQVDRDAAGMWLHTYKPNANRREHQLLARAFARHRLAVEQAKDAQIATDAAEALAAWNDRPTPDGLRYQRAEGETLAEMRENARKSDLHPRGDMALVWVNEADLPLRGESRNV